MPVGNLLTQKENDNIILWKNRVIQFLNNVGATGQVSLLIICTNDICMLLPIGFDTNKRHDWRHEETECCCSCIRAKSFLKGLCSVSIDVLETWERKDSRSGPCSGISRYFLQSVWSRNMDIGTEDSRCSECVPVSNWIRTMTPIPITSIRYRWWSWSMTEPITCCKKILKSSSSE